MRLRSTLRAAAVAALTALMLGACAGTPDGGNGPEAPRVSPLEALSLASAKTTEAKTARFTLSMDSDIAGAGEELNVQGEGAMDFATNTMHMTMDAAGEQVEMVFDGKAYYMKIPSLQSDPDAAQAFGGKPWLKMDLEALSEASGTDLTGLSQNTNNDPTQALRYLQGASDDVREVGKEQVRGVETTRYTATLDLRKALEEQAPEYREQMEKSLEQLTSTSLPADVWIDGEGRLAKMEYTMAVKESAAQPGGNVKTTMEFFDYGTAVDVTVPPADQVTDFAEVLQQLQLQGLTG